MFILLHLNKQLVFIHYKVIVLLKKSRFFFLILGNNWIPTTEHEIASENLSIPFPICWHCNFAFLS
jgi:hypothetical protein